MRKENKTAIIKQITVFFERYDYFYLLDVSTLNAVKTSNLRMECHKLDIKFIIVKNTLFKKALEQVKEKDFSSICTVLKGNTGVMFSNNAGSPAKLIRAFAKKIGVPKLKVAYVHEEFYIGEKNLDLLVFIKSKDELIYNVVVLLQSPTRNMISAIRSGGEAILGVLKMLSIFSKG